MVKLGNNFSEKTNGKVVSEDGFDTIPLITPLDASQLQFPPPDKVCFHFSHIAYNCITCIKNKHADFTSHVFFFFFSWSGCVLFSCQVVVKTKADYDGESKKGKLRSPKIAEFSISIIEGVSERLKVRITELLQSVFHASSISQYTPTHAHPWEQTCVCLLLRTFFIPPPIIIFPPQHSSYLLAPSFSPLSPPCPPLLPVILAGYTERHNAHWFT